MSLLARQRDTPTRSSPFSKASQPRTSLKPRQDTALQLERVIGSTCSSPTRFHTNNATSTFAYVAGAAAVLTTIGPDFSLEQRFFRANPTLTSTSRPSSNGSKDSGNPQDFRSRLGRETRAGSPFSNNGQTDNADTGSSGHAKDRVKAATAVAISNNGKLLAFGETGYRPRVLIFPITDKRCTDTPSAIISEHSFGISAVAFDSEGKLLATLGSINDGFIYIWELDPKTSAPTLLAVNKCTTPVKQMAWMGKSLVTVGLRYVKVWRPYETAPSSGFDDFMSNPAHKPLVGRNSVLGDMLEATFTAVVPMSDSKALICSDAGDVCILDDTGRQQKLVRVMSTQMSITAACHSDDGYFLITGSDNSLEEIKLPTEARSDTPLSRSGSPDEKKLKPRKDVHAVALGAVAGVIVSVKSDHSIVFRELHPTSATPPRAVLASHCEPVLGVRPAVSADQTSTSFATWSTDGLVHGWSEDLRAGFSLDVPMEEADAGDMPDELRTIFPTPDGKYIIAGDRYGMLSVMEIASNDEVVNLRAHGSEISDISLYDDKETIYVATASRDRTVQLFTWNGKDMQLAQTLDEHAGAVQQVAFTADGERLLSISTDRTLVVRERMQADDGSTIYGILRTVNLKAAPTAMSLAADSNHVLVAAMDRTVSTVDINTGKMVSSFKAGDNEGGDTVPLSDIVRLVLPSGPIIAGVSSVDKSIRLYSDDGTLLARDWGHTEGVTGIAVLPGASSKPQLVTAAADGTIFVWSVHIRARPDPVVKDEDSPVTTPLSRPLRKVISLNEISRIRRSLGVGGTDSEPSTPAQRSRLTLTQGPRFSTGTPGKGSPSSPTRDRTPSPSRPTRPPLSPTRSSPSKLSEASRRPISSPRTVQLSKVESVPEEREPSKSSDTKALAERIQAFRSALTLGCTTSLDREEMKQLLVEMRTLEAVLLRELGHDEDSLAKAMKEVSLTL